MNLTAYFYLQNVLLTLKSLQRHNKPAWTSYIKNQCYVAYHMLEHVSDTTSFNSQTPSETMVRKLFIDFFSRIAVVALLINF